VAVAAVAVGAEDRVVEVVARVGLVPVPVPEVVEEAAGPAPAE
jgi:hypothetical protein